MVSLVVPGLLEQNPSGSQSSSGDSGDSAGAGAGDTTDGVMSRNRPSDFPKHTGRDGREVLGEFNAKFPQYRIEIVQESDPDAIASLDQTVRDDRIRMFVTRTGKVTRMYLG